MVSEYKLRRVGMKFIDLNAQYEAYQSDIDNAIAQVLTHGRFIMGAEVADLENTLSNYTDVSHCITTASGTNSLEIALRALDIGPGDEVITVPFTWISPAEAIELVGAKPVFVDIEPYTFNMDMSQVEEAITMATKAIIPVSLFGQSPDLETANQLATKHGLAVIEDGAQSFGALRNGRRSCGITDIGSTSFFPAKPLGCYGDGGALFTDNDALSEKMRILRAHGGKRRHHHTMIGMNGRLDTIQAAILLAKFPNFPEEIQRRGEIGNRYNQALRDVCIIPKTMDGNTHVYGQYTVRTPNRKALRETLQIHGIPSAVYYPKCLHEQPVFQRLGYRLGDFPESEKASKEVISLPMHPFLKQDEQDRVIEVVKSALMAYS